ncbi:hypothetical protein DCE79_11115 [Lysinibacillus sp. 2017]|uniref:helix-turn-helix domain-containing protein n=1 Tax=unclassified Lysinibacillus TaxID=2636778 RepID=UPI000D526BC0|nr:MULTISPECIES: helix-turn-helix transcriptional regulator [unclassified Lysinibacillus]AWE07902.1 hypothetical protein DCE79_11115 [Lysinibacillus sp. 2017]TGN33150.1 XRE family transcriptional regulator [Lysinibacillus sp. S2017]
MSNYINGEDALKALFNNNEVDPHDPIHIIFHLKARMKERGLTQQQLAEMSGVRQATISQLCRGNVERLHIPTLEKIAAAMNITDITQLLSFLPESEIMSGGNPYDIVFNNDKNA